MTLPSAFETLKAGFKGDIVLPSDEGYQDAIHRWAVNAQKPAAAVLYVKDDADIAAAVAFAVQHRVDFAVRGECTLSPNPDLEGRCASRCKPQRRELMQARRRPLLQRCQLIGWRASHRPVPILQVRAR